MVTKRVDDKFTVLSYGNTEEPVTLPGLALDADPRFPFYNISEEVDKVDPDEGGRVNLYLQLKTLQSPQLKGKILIDSPGFDADSQRDGVLRITKHIVEMSDLVLVFFDARHPEPGAMRDTLKHLVDATIGHKDANKMLYILNQIDTSAKEDNLEDVISSWQRALANEGLISGNFYTIYNENASNKIEDKALEARLKRKKDIDLAKIIERMDKVSIERAYRIIKSLETFAKELTEKKIPLLQELLQGWWRKVLFSDVAMLVIIASALGFAQAEFGFFDSMMHSPILLLNMSIASLCLLLITHIKARKFFAKRLAKQWEDKDMSISKAIVHNTQWWKLLMGVGGRNWHKKSHTKLAYLMNQSKKFIQSLNDQYVGQTRKKEDV
ncbi:MAG: dynamin family protein [Sulfurovum sp.]|nr:dynamin family protein [Sulfurovum sp.]